LYQSRYLVKGRLFEKERDSGTNGGWLPIEKGVSQKEIRCTIRHKVFGKKIFRAGHDWAQPPHDAPPDEKTS